MKGVPVPSGAPAPLAPLPPRRLPQNVHSSMTRSVHFSVAIDTSGNARKHGRYMAHPIAERRRIAAPIRAMKCLVEEVDGQID